MGAQYTNRMTKKMMRTGLRMRRWGELGGFSGPPKINSAASTVGSDERAALRAKIAEEDLWNGEADER